MGDRPLFNVICTTLLIEKSPQALPLGAACIASAIKNDLLTKDLCSVYLDVYTLEDYELNRIDLSIEKKAQIIVDKILLRKPEIVAFSVFVWNREILEIVGTDLQKKGVVTIAGGPEITASPKMCSGFDFLVCGEGERSVPKLINSILNKTIKIHSGESTIISPDVCEDLSISPYLDGTLNPSDYGGVLWELARGCPFKCSYCYESKGSKNVRLFPMDRIEKELDLFKKLNIPQVFVLDPTYNANKKRAMELLSLISKKTPSTFYYFEVRAEFIDRDLAKAFTRIPCALQIGLQSANVEVLKLVNRNLNKQLFTRNIGYLNEFGVVFGLDLIYGLPGETFESFKNGIDYAISLYPNNLEIFRLSVLPGTDLFDKAQDLKLTYQQTPPYNIIKTNLFSEDDLKKASELADSCSIFYNQGRSVPWFNSLCRSLHLKPSLFFKKFSEYLNEHKLSRKELCKKLHREIEVIQIDFVKSLLLRNNRTDLETLIVDLIKFNGALSRTQDTGKEEIVKLNYDSEYLASQYATDLNYFVKNIKRHNCTIKTFKRNGYSDWR